MPDRTRLETSALNSPAERARILMEMRRYGDAEQFLRLCLEEDPSDGHARAMLARCLQKQDKIKDALVHAKRAVETDPNLGIAHAILAEVFQQAGTPMLAWRAVVAALHCEPSNPSYLCLAACLQMNRGDMKGAGLSLDRALKVDPERPDTKRLYARLLEHNDRRTEAILTSSEAVAENPVDATVLTGHGHVLLWSGNWSGAAESFQAAIRIDPNSSSARVGLAEAMKCRFAPYRLLFRAQHWAGKKPARMLAILVAAYLALVSGLASAATAANESMPALAGSLMAATILLSLAISCRSPWNLLLMIHPRGKGLLTGWDRAACLITTSLILFTTYCSYGLLIDSRDNSNVMGFLFGLVLCILTSRLTAPVKRK